MNWFKDWFNSKYYHILYKNRNQIEAKLFLDKLINYLPIQKNQKIIDVACGKGRHSIYLNRLGFNVHGVDLSKKSIDIAKKYENKSLQFSIHDMRKGYKANYFDLSINLFTSFGYFSNNQDDQDAINAMSSNLKENGILIIDFMNVNNVIANLLHKEKKIIQNIEFNIKREIKKNYIIKNINIKDKKKNEVFQEKVKMLTLDDFLFLIKNANLKIIDIFGDYKLNPFNTQKSERLILICKK